MRTTNKAARPKATFMERLGMLATYIKDNFMSCAWELFKVMASMLVSRIFWEGWLILPVSAPILMQVGIIATYVTFIALSAILVFNLVRGAYRFFTADNPSLTPESVVATETLDSKHRLHPAVLERTANIIRLRTQSEPALGSSDNAMDNDASVASVASENKTATDPATLSTFTLSTREPLLNKEKQLVQENIDCRSPMRI